MASTNELGSLGSYMEMCTIKHTNDTQKQTKGVKKPTIIGRTTTKSHIL